MDLSFYTQEVTPALIRGLWVSLGLILPSAVFGLAIGILMGNVLEVSTELGAEASYFSMVFLFGGIALVLSHFLGRRVSKE